jgi:hypothetical protein
VIFFLVTAGCTDAIRRLLRSPSGRRLRGRLVPLTYERVLGRMTRSFWRDMLRQAWWELARESRSPLDPDTRHAATQLAARAGRLLRARAAPAAGHYIFADLERLSPDQALRARWLWEELARSSRGARLLNHPTRAMRRYELLRVLHERGINTFDVYRLTEGRWPARYPVFLRGENDHGGARSGLLRTRHELEDAIAAVERDRGSREGVLITEFCDTADDQGLYRKYSAFVVGDTVFPKNVLFSKHWVLKRTDLLEEDLLREERAHVETNPHADRLREIFRLARIEYGRVDYGLLNGAIQVWEINTNPHVTSLDPRGPDRRAIYEAVEQRMTRALEEVAAGPAPSAYV